MLKQGKCILCGSIAEVDEHLQDDGLACACICDICGQFDLSPRAFKLVKRDEDLRYKFRVMLKERLLKGFTEFLTITVKAHDAENHITVEELISRYPRSAGEMIDRTLLNLSMFMPHPFSECNIDYQQMPSVTFARNPQEAFNMVQTLLSMGYITYKPSGGGTDGIPSGKVAYGVTSDGWKKIEESLKSNINSKQAFVAMWFNDEMISIWEEGLSKGIEDAGYLAFRIDNKEHNDKICDEIIAEIRRSKFVVADFTKNRGGVYFEAGFALGLGIPVIWTVRQDFLKEEGVHFDTRQYNHIDYNTPDELRNRLSNRIRATIL